jgi:glutathione synthase/RimK-type ligase-like ATP-grasp enzyme
LDRPIILATARNLADEDVDDAPLHAALAAAGVPAVTRAWDDEGVDWAGARGCVLRSTWDYHERAEEFLRWAASVATMTPLWNPLPVVRWNSHKGYLVELASRGVPVVPTRLLRRGSSVVLSEVAEHWEDVVIKPAISAGSFLTIRVARAAFPRGQAHLDAQLPLRDMMVQPYFPSVETHGERAVVWIDGTFTHEIVKHPRFSGQPEKVSPAAPVAAAELTVAEAVMAAVPLSDPLLYARVDLARDPTGSPHLMELELIEPSLYLAERPTAAARLAAAIARRCP